MSKWKNSQMISKMTGFFAMIVEKLFRKIKSIINVENVKIICCANNAMI